MGAMNSARCQAVYSGIPVTAAVVLWCMLFHFCGENTKPTLPTLLSQPGVWFVSTSSIWVDWWGDYKGDGPGKEEEKNADIPQSTNDYVLLRLSHPPKRIAIGTSYAIVQWQKQHTGNGPICAYAIDRRSFGKDAPSWSTVGFVSEQSGSQSREELTFNITGLKPEMGYRVSVRPVLCDGARASEVGEGPLLFLKTLSIVLPTLMEAPLITNLSSTNVAIRWTNHYQGDGPICGYGINIKKNDDKDRGDDDDSDPWRSVGYVSVESELLYDVGHLEANTTYQVVVSPINCISARESPREPILHCTTKTVKLPVVALPRLLTRPQVKGVTTATIKIEWKGDYDGDGPVCGFVVELRHPASRSWTSVGFVSFDEDEDVFDYTIERLDSNTLYWISVRILHCSGREGERGFDLYESTKGRELQTEPPSISTSKAPPCPAQKWRKCPQNPLEDDYPWKMMFFIALFPLLFIIIPILFVIIGICCT